MDITILNQDLVEIGILDVYDSLIWTDRYNSYGDFEIYTPVSQEFLDTIKQDYYLTSTKSDRVMIVERLTIDTDLELGNNVTVVGRSLESILTRRIVWGQKVLTGNLQNAVKTLLNENIINPSIAARKISNFVFRESTDTEVTKYTISAQYTGDNLYDAIVDICTSANIGFKVTLEDGKFVFQLYAGKNRTYDQTENPYVIFSPSFDNIINSTYIESKEDLMNVTLIGGEGEGSERTYTTYGENSSGLTRRELFTDARDLSSRVSDSDDTTGMTISTDEHGTRYMSRNDYLKLLQQRGKERLGEHNELKSFSGKSETSTLFVYGVDFFLGDIVQVENEYGQGETSRITEIITSENKSEMVTYPTFTHIDTSLGS